MYYTFTLVLMSCIMLKPTSAVPAQSATTCDEIGKRYPLESLYTAQTGEAWLDLAKNMMKETEIWNVDDDDAAVIKLRQGIHEIDEALNLMTIVLQTERPFKYDDEQKLLPEHFRPRTRRAGFQLGRPLPIKYRPEYNRRIKPPGKIITRKPTTSQPKTYQPKLPDKHINININTISRLPFKAKSLLGGAQVGTRIGFNVVKQNPSAFRKVMKWVAKASLIGAAGLSVVSAGFIGYAGIMYGIPIDGSEEEQAAEIDMVSITEMGNAIMTGIVNVTQLLIDAKQGHISYYAIDSNRWEELKQIDGVSLNWNPMQGADAEYDEEQDTITLWVPSSDC